MHTRQQLPQLVLAPDELSLLVRGSGAVDSILDSERSLAEMTAGLPRARLLGSMLRMCGVDGRLSRGATTSSEPPHERKTGGVGRDTIDRPRRRGEGPTYVGEVRP